MNDYSFTCVVRAAMREGNARTGWITVEGQWELTNNPEKWEV